MTDKYGNWAEIDYVRLNRNGETYEYMYRLIIKDRSFTVFHVSVYATEEEAETAMHEILG